MLTGQAPSRACPVAGVRLHLVPFPRSIADPMAAIALPLRWRVVAFFGLMSLLTPAWANTVTIPLSLDHGFIRALLATQVYTQENQSVRVWDDGKGCNFLVLSDPRVDSAGGRLRVVSRGQAQVGTALGKRCLKLVRWSGYLEAFEDASLEPGAPVIRFRVVERLWAWRSSTVHREARR